MQILFIFSLPILFFILLTSVFGLIIWSGYKFYKNYQLMLTSFSKKNNLVFSKKSNYHPYNLKARIFQNKHNKNIRNFFSGKLLGDDLKIFNYQYIVQSGKNSTTYHFTIGEVTIEKTFFPHIILRSRKSWRHQSKIMWGANKDFKINLEDEFKKDFELHCTIDYEVETLQIFTPEVLRFIKEKDNKIIIEFADNKIYFIKNKIIYKEDELQNFYNLISDFINLKSERLHRMNRDFEVMHEAYSKR